jgi:hypothetical protein
LSSFVPARRNKDLTPFVVYCRQFAAGKNRQGWKVRSMGVEFELLTNTSPVDWSEGYSGLSMGEGAGA